MTTEKEKEVVSEEEQIEEVSEKEENQEPELTEEEKMAQENQALNDKYLRLNAEFQNYKRRTEAEKTEIYAYANEKLMVDLLEVIDNYDRAMASLDQNVEPSLTQGIHMIYNQLQDILKKFGLAEIEALDNAFDHNFHHAVMQEEVEGKEADIVVDVLQKGYTLKDKVIRHSMVKVSK